MKTSRRGWIKLPVKVRFYLIVDFMSYITLS